MNWFQWRHNLSRCQDACVERLDENHVGILHCYAGRFAREKIYEKTEHYNYPDFGTLMQRHLLGFNHMLIGYPVPRVLRWYLTGRVPGLAHLKRVGCDVDIL